MTGYVLCSDERTPVPGSLSRLEFTPSTSAVEIRDFLHDRGLGAYSLRRAVVDLEPDHQRSERRESRRLRHLVEAARTIEWE